MMVTMIRLFTITIIAAGLLLGSAGAASARPVLDEPAGPCGPGQSFTIYDWRSDSLVTHCTSTIHVPRQVALVKKPSFWKPWTWTFN